MGCHFQKIVDFLNKHAPKAPLAESISLANEFQALNDAEYYYKCIIAILSHRLLTDTGSIRDEFSEGRPAWQMALKELQQCHAWVVCGPAPNAMDKLLCEFDAKNQTNK